MSLTNLFCFIALNLSVCLSLCPDARLIQPCVCQSEDKVVTVFCSELQSGQQLKKLFAQPFPTNDLWHLTIQNSKLDDIEANLFSEKSFYVILLQNVTIDRIPNHALAASVDRLRVLSIDSSPLKQLSVQGIADLENLIDFEVTMSGLDSLTDFPSLPNLQYLHLYGNRFEKPPVLPYLPKLHSLWLNSGHLTTVRPLNFSNLPSLKKLVLFGNQIHHLNDGDLHFESPVLELVDLSENHVISISPDAIRGIGLNTVLDLRKSNIDTLNEMTFRPILDMMKRGTGHLNLNGNMLQCDCYTVGWLTNRTALTSRISQLAKCNDGFNFHAKLSRLNCSSSQEQ